MKKLKKTIVYIVIALFVVVSVAFVDAGNLFAKSFNDVTDSDWHFYVKTGKSSTEFELPENRVDASIDDATAYDSSLGHNMSKCKYIERFGWACTDYYRTGVENTKCVDYLFASDSEIVLIYENKVTDELLGFSSLSSSYYSGGNYAVFAVASQSPLYGYGTYRETTNIQKIRRSWTTTTKGYYGGIVATHEYGTNEGEFTALNSYKMKVFNSFSDADKYFKSGDLSGLLWQGGEPKQTYSPELAFTSFDMSVHDSNSFDDYYLEFIYKCPDSWLGKNPKLVINQTWDYNIFYFDNKGTSSPLTVNGSNTCALSVSGDKNSIKIPLGQLDCLNEFVSSSNNVLGASSEMKRRVLGSSYSSPPLGKVLTFNGLPIRADASYKVDKSFLSLSCVVYVDGVAGHEYAGSVDLISGDNSMASYTPDTSGDYTYNDDYKSGGRYYTNVGKDAAGNTTYNYYYYGTDGSKKDVSSEDAANNTITNTVQDGAIRIDNSPTFNNNITVEGDTISNSANSYADSKSDASTNKSFIDKFLGFFEIIENNSFLGVFSKIFAWLPTGVSSLVTTALGIIVGIRVFKAFH